MILTVCQFVEKISESPQVWFVINFLVSYHFQNCHTFYFISLILDNFIIYLGHSGYTELFNLLNI